MLTAAMHGKLKRSIKLWEDEVTSCIFGTLQHYSPIEIVKFFDELVRIAGIKKEDFLYDSTLNVEFTFWPKLGQVEPDLVVSLFYSNKLFLKIILEVKWDSKLSPACELVRQWKWREKSDDIEWLHLYIVKDKASGSKEINSSLVLVENNTECQNYSCYHSDCKKINEVIFSKNEREIWKQSLGCVGWCDVIVVMNTVFKNELLSLGTSRFFEKQGISPFSGFQWLSDFQICQLKDDQFFNNEPWFLFLSEISVDNEPVNFYNLDFNN